MEWSGDSLISLSLTSCKFAKLLGSSQRGQHVLRCGNPNVYKCGISWESLLSQYFLQRTASTHHVLHVRRRWVDLTSELVVKVQDELSVTVSNGPLPSLLGLPPAPVLVQVLVQNLLPARGVRKHHHGCGRVEQQEQDHAHQPVQGQVLHPS